MQQWILWKFFKLNASRLLNQPFVYLLGKNNKVTILAKFRGFEGSCTSGPNSTSVCQKSIAAASEKNSYFGAIERTFAKTIEIKILLYNESIHYQRGGKNHPQTTSLHSDWKWCPRCPQRPSAQRGSALCEGLSSVHLVRCTTGAWKRRDLDSPLMGNICYHH